MKYEVDIPEGYKVVEDHCTMQGNSAKITLIAEKKDKTFEQYVEEYFALKEGIHKLTHILINVSGVVERNKEAILTRPCGVLFEIRIGLFKYICDDLKLNWLAVISGKWMFSQTYSPVYQRLQNIIPKEFLDSLVK